MRPFRMVACLIGLLLLPVTVAAYNAPMPLALQRPIAKCPPQGCPPVYGAAPMAGLCGPGPQFALCAPSLRMRLDGKAGPMWITENVDFPFIAPDPLNPQFAFERMSLTLDTTNFWAGFVRLEFDPLPNITLYGEIGGSIPRNATVKMNATGRAVLPEPDNAQNLVSPWTWKAQNIVWWMIEGGGVLWLTSTLGFEVGFRSEGFDYRMTDPRNSTQASAIGIAGGLAPGNAITCARI